MLSITNELFEIAPVDLPVRRTLRYDGSGYGLTLTHFAARDREVLLQIYGRVKTIYDLWLSPRDRPDAAALAAAVRPAGSDAFVTAVQRLGEASATAAPLSPLQRQVLHDVRGGALTALAGSASWLALGSAPASLLTTCVYLARDHAKIMRNALVDLDPPTRSADEAARVHLIDHFIEKWSGAAMQLAGRDVRVTVECAFQGSVSARCLETSAIDRILYNYTNNASRFTADGAVRLAIFPVGEALVRWVVSNTLTADQVAWLRSRAPDLKRLYEGGLTHGGQGIGLTACADFVASCFGLASRREAVAKGYLGARVVEDRYHAWFHWPIHVAAGFQSAD